MLDMIGLGALTHIGGGAGGLLVLIGWIWLVVMGFKTELVWGLIALLLGPLGALVFGIVKWPMTQTPLILMVVGLILGGGLGTGILG